MKLQHLTEQFVQLGPILEEDGITPATGLTLGSGEIFLSKNNGLFSESVATGEAEHDRAGFYRYLLHEDDVEELGNLKISIDESGILPYWDDFDVVDEEAEKLEFAEIVRKELYNRKFVASSFQQLDSVNQTNTYTATHVEDGTTHTIAPDGADSNGQYIFNLGAVTTNTVRKATLYVKAQVDEIAALTIITPLDPVGIELDPIPVTGTLEMYEYEIPEHLLRESQLYVFVSADDSPWGSPTWIFDFIQIRAYEVPAANDVLENLTYGEPGSGAPGSNISLKDKIGYLYKAWRNRCTQTSSTYSLFNDNDSTVGQRSTIADDGTTFTRNKIIEP